MAIRSRRVRFPERVGGCLLLPSVGRCLFCHQNPSFATLAANLFHPRDELDALVGAGICDWESACTITSLARASDDFAGFPIPDSPDTQRLSGGADRSRGRLQFPPTGAETGAGGGRRLSDGGYPRGRAPKDCIHTYTITILSKCRGIFNLRMGRAGPGRKCESPARGECKRAGAIPAPAPTGSVAQSPGNLPGVSSPGETPVLEPSHDASPPCRMAAVG